MGAIGGDGGVAEAERVEAEIAQVLAQRLPPRRRRALMRKAASFLPTVLREIPTRSATSSMFIPST